jgi:hypothetical protein
MPTAYPSARYDNAEFVVANTTVNYDVKSNQTNLFGGVSSNVGQVAYFIRISTDQTVTLRFNDTGQDAITLTSSMSPMILDNTIEVSNIYITNNSGSNANVKVLAAKPNF